MAPAQGDAGAGSGLTALLPLIIMFVIFYFLLIRPQQKKTKQHQEFLNNLKKDDLVVTTGGIHGKITGIADNIVTLEVAPNVRIKVSRSGIAGLSELAAKTTDEKNK
ncbi:MAG: preprotein translocase subunit YajC [Desulfobacterota bacterium]|nr:preprotein translocase subunit YajC [Thermodesulfobacteriota bacterium]